MKRMNGLDWAAYILLIIGGLNWGLVGLFQYDLVAALFGGPSSIISRIIYILVGLSAIYMAVRVATATAETETRRPAME